MFVCPQSRINATVRLSEGQGRSAEEAEQEGGKGIQDGFRAG